MSPIPNKRLSKPGFLFCFICIMMCFVFFAEASYSKKRTEYLIRIISPEEDETFQNASQSIRVLLDVFPRLEVGDSILLYVDGKQATFPSNNTIINLPWLDRGQHSLQAIILDKYGARTESEIVNFYQQRTSRILSPAFR